MSSSVDHHPSDERPDPRADSGAATITSSSSPPVSVGAVPWARLVPPAVLAVVLHLIVVAGDEVPAVDTVNHLEAGRNLVEGRGFTRFGAPELHFPPVVPTTLGILTRLTGSEVIAVRTWSLVTGLALAAVLIALTRRLWDDDDVTVTGAWIVAAAGALTPLGVRQGSGSEVAAAALVLGALLVVLGPPARSRPRPRRGLGALAGAGALAGLAYLTRPEALLPGLLLGAAVLVDAVRRRPAADGDRRSFDPSAPIAFAVGLLIVALPYISYLHDHTGSWAPTGKSRDVSIEAWRAVAEDDRAARDVELYRIDATGVGLDDETTSLTSLAREDPVGWLGIVSVNARTLVRMLFVPFVSYGVAWSLLPLPLTAAAGWALVRGRRRRSVVLTAAVGALPMATCLVFFVQPRYLVLSAAVLAAAAPRGLVDGWRAARSRGWIVGWRRVAAVGVLAVLMASTFLAEARPLLPWAERTEYEEQVAAGEWLRAMTDPDARVMTRSFHIQYYGRRPVVALPYGEPDQVLAFAHARGVEYIVVDRRTIRNRRPQLTAWLVDDPTPVGLVEVAHFGRGGSTIRVLRLAPAPVESDLPPLPLGFVGD